MAQKLDISVEEFLALCDLDEPLYPGKRMIKKFPKQGEYKSHCVVYDWRSPDKIIVEVKAGLSGRDLPIKTLKKYPPSLQSKTVIEFDVKDAA